MNDWIKITDKNKPEDSENVLVYISFGGKSYEIDLALYVEEEDKFLNSDDNYIRKELVTHWMPLPNGPNNSQKSVKEALSTLKIVPSDTLIGKEHTIMLKFINMIIVSSDEDFFVDIKMTAKTIINNLKSQK